MVKHNKKSIHKNTRKVVCPACNTPRYIVKNQKKSIVIKCTTCNFRFTVDKPTVNKINLLVQIQSDKTSALQNDINNWIWPAFWWFGLPLVLIFIFHHVAVTLTAVDFLIYYLILGYGLLMLTLIIRIFVSGSYFKTMVYLFVIIVVGVDFLFHAAPEDTKADLIWIPMVVLTVFFIFLLIDIEVVRRDNEGASGGSCSSLSSSDAGDSGGCGGGGGCGGCGG